MDGKLIWRIGLGLSSCSHEPIIKWKSGPIHNRRHPAAIDPGSQLASLSSQRNITKSERRENPRAERYFHKYISIKESILSVVCFIFRPITVYTSRFDVFSSSFYSWIFHWIKFFFNALSMRFFLVIIRSFIHHYPSHPSHILQWFGWSALRTRELCLLQWITSISLIQH